MLDFIDIYCVVAAKADAVRHVLAALWIHLTKELCVTSLRSHRSPRGCHKLSGPVALRIAHCGPL